MSKTHGVFFTKNTLQVATFMFLERLLPKQATTICKKQKSFLQD